MYISGMSNTYIMPLSNVKYVTPVNTDNSVDSSTKIESTGECKTCASRSYVDGSDENNVSFKTPGKIAPEQSYAMVSTHERQHVSNAIKKGNRPGAKLISASVTLKMATCPECGKRYVAGGLTTTQIKYDNSNPYDVGRKLIEGEMIAGIYVDEKV